MAKKSPTQLSLDFMRKSGWTCEITEHWNAFARVRKDLLGFGDILCYKPGGSSAWPDDTGSIALVQTTSETNFNARKRKIQSSVHYKPWKRAGGFVVLHGWGKNGLREEYL